MSDDQKPDRPKRVHTLCLDFNAFSMEPYVNNLLKKMKNLVPEFLVNVAYKSKTVSQLFSTNSKGAVPFIETPNICYQFRCHCGSHYIGHSERPMIDRLQEHQQPSKAKGVLWHILSCPEYLKKKKDIVIFDPSKKKISKEKSYQFFLSHFKILQKSFRSHDERKKTEAFYIRVKRPDLNDQRDHKAFKLF